MPGRQQLRIASAFLAVALVAGCGDDGPTALQHCEATPVLPAEAVAHVTDEALAAAVNTAAFWAESLPSGSGDTGRLEAELLGLLDTADDAASCRGVLAARTLLGNLGEDPSTAPARAGIGVTIDVVETYLATRP